MGFLLAETEINYPGRKLGRFSQLQCLGKTMRGEDHCAFPFKNPPKLDRNERLILNDEEPLAGKRGLEHRMSLRRGQAHSRGIAARWSSL
jgi:hypothetical protein